MQTKSDSINAEIKNQILILKQKNDSLTKRLDQIEKNDYKSVEVIEKVNDFYDKSWNKLIWFLSIAGSIILVVIPYLQNKNHEEVMNSKTKEFENLLNTKTEELEIKITKLHSEESELLRKEIISSQEKLNKNIENETKYVQAYVFVLRGIISLKEEDYNMCFKQYTIAANLFICTDKNSAVESIIKATNEVIAKCISKKIKINKDAKKRIDKLISVLEKDYYEHFPNIIDELKTESAKLETT